MDLLLPAIPAGAMFGGLAPGSSSGTKRSEVPFRGPPARATPHATPLPLRS